MRSVDMYHIKAPEKYRSKPRPWVFLAGVIDMGNSRDWQQIAFDRIKGLRGTVLNPRRENWDSSWKQTSSNASFREQVIWELRALNDADFVFVNVDGDSKAPITLLELGYLAGLHKPVAISAHPDFWRRGNIEVLTEMHSQQMRLYASLDDALNVFTSWIKQYKD